MEKAVKEIREKEKQVATDVKSTNLLLDIKTQLNNSNAARDIRLAALHALRRLFVQFLEAGRLTIATESSTSNNSQDKLREYKQWLHRQYESFKDDLCALILSGDDALIAPSIRTLIEFVRRDFLAKNNARGPIFGVETFTRLIKALLSASELSAEILILFREEVLLKPDCAYYTMILIKKELKNFKISHRMKSIINSSSSSAEAKSSSCDNGVIDTFSPTIEGVIRNALDILRMLNLQGEEQGIERDNLLVQQGNDDADGEVSGSDDDDDVDESSDSEAETPQLKKKLGSRQVKIQPEQNSKKRRRKLTRAEQIVTWTSHRKAYSQVWIMLLSLPLTVVQHKVVLKHLPNFVISHLEKPLLLSDYLTRCYERGGVIAVLALESLFQLIVKFNLDYPDFFISLYRMCTPEVFSAKYRSKFLRLLTLSLQSTNLSAHIVASFIKRLAYLSLNTPSPCAIFCVAQITTLLKRHPQCIQLIHRGNGHSARAPQFDNIEDRNLEENHALTSSLWEMHSLSKHHLHSVVALVKSLEGAASTDVGKGGTLLIMNEYVDHNYAELMEAEIKKLKKNAPLNFRNPGQLFPEGDLTTTSFGSNV